jgi:hypothetical protein
MTFNDLQLDQRFVFKVDMVVEKIPIFQKTGLDTCAEIKFSKFYGPQENFWYLGQSSIANLNAEVCMLDL